MDKNIKSEHLKIDLGATLVLLFLPISYHPIIDFLFPFRAFIDIGISQIIAE